MGVESADGGYTDSDPVVDGVNASDRESTPDQSVLSSACELTMRMLLSSKAGVSTKVRFPADKTGMGAEPM
jgi:hypothetical protein